MRILWAAVGLAAWSSAAPAASIMVRSTSDDAVGQSIVYNLRNEIAGSALHKVVYNPEDAGFIISVITLKLDDGRSVYSATLLVPPFDGKGFDYYLTGVVGYCGSSVTKSCGSGILSSFDKDIADVVSAVAKAAKK